MIVLGVDPGGRDTGLAVVGDGIPTHQSLLASRTVHRTGATRTLASVPRSYILDVMVATLELVNAAEPRLIAVEGVTRPKGHATGRSGHLIDPSGLLATAQILGAILGRAWSVPVVVIPPGGNGSFLPLARYPEPLATTGKGNDKRRHERSAYDVAMQGQAYARLERIPL